jgi:hypothetical protein
MREFGGGVNLSVNSELLYGDQLFATRNMTVCLE